MGSNLQDKSPPTNKFTLDFLQHITNNFSDDRILGRGGGGVVYKGVLDTGEEIALKKLNRIEFDDKEFTNEFNNNIFRAHHQNIVQFVGYCYHEDRRCIELHGQYVFALEAEGILCFEYLHGGDLERHLSDEQPCRLDWQTCYKIIKGVCAGLNYLHSKHIYHLDLKPQNILLDNNMMPKIGDFGISRIFPSTKTITTATTTLTGTMGFMPPEYIDKQEISSKFDVFSLGATIVQIMAGRQNYWNCGHVPSENFTELVWEIWRKKIHPKMLSDTWLEVNTCIGIGLRCLQVDPKKRPTIRETVDELNRIDIKNLTLTDEIINELNQNDRIALKKYSFTDEVTNLQRRVALAYNHYKNSGMCEMIEVLLSKGAGINSISSCGTPLHAAIIGKQDAAVKTLLDHHADCNKAMAIHYTPLIAAIHVCSLKCVKLLIKAGADVKGVAPLTPLIAAAEDGLTDFYKPLLAAGADPDVRDDGGQLPIEIVARNSRRKDVEILFPVTSRIPYVRDWSVDGILAYVKSVPKEEDDPLYKMGPAYLKSEGNKAYKRKDYVSGINFYNMASKVDPEDVTLHSNRSICWINLGEGDKALEAAELCRMIRPDWPKACYRQGAAQMFLKNYEKACDAFQDGLKLDPTNVEIENALREAFNSLKRSRAKTVS